MEKISKYKAFYFLSKLNKVRLTNCLMLRFLQEMILHLLFQSEYEVREYVHLP